VHRCFAVPEAVNDPCQGIVVIVEGDGGRRIGLVIDELLGQQQVVVKSLESNYDSVDGVGGATILGNGRVALILDVARLSANEAQRVAPRADRPQPHAHAIQ
jgi:two-component system, chemotaxis family, sensor kinase CheA